MENCTTEWNNTDLLPLHYFSTDYLKHDKKWAAIFVSAYAFIFILGLIGNLAVIIVICKYSFMRTVTNLFILNLAVADLFVVIFCLPATLLTNIFVPWMFNNVLCVIMPYIQGVSVFASVYSMVAISLDRCTSFYRPVGKTSIGFTKPVAKVIILLIWILGLLAHSPLLNAFQVCYSLESVDYGMPYCWEQWKNPEDGNRFFISVPLSICFAGPLLAICFLNLVIWWHLQRFEKLAEKQELPLRYDTRGVTKMLWIIAMTFLVCWSPLLALLCKVKFFGPMSSETLQDVLMGLAQLMGSCNSCINPILYAFHSIRFRVCVTNLNTRNNRRHR